MRTVLNQKLSCLLKGGLAFFIGGKGVEMKNKFFKAAFVMIVAMSLCLGTFKPTIGQEYSVIDLGTLGGESSLSTGINDLGQIAGKSDIGDNTQPYHAFLYSNSIMHDLGTLGGSNSYAFAINNS